MTRRPSRPLTRSCSSTTAPRRFPSCRCRPGDRSRTWCAPRALDRPRSRRRRARCSGVRAVGLHRRLVRRSAAASLDAVDHLCMSSPSRVEGVVDDRLGRRVGRGQAHRAAAVLGAADMARPTRRAPRGRPCPRRRCATGATWNWMSGAGRASRDPREAARLGEVGGERAGLGRFELLQRGRLEREQQALGLGRRPDELGGGMIGQVLARPRAGRAAPRSRASPGARPGRRRRASAAAASCRRRRRGSPRARRVAPATSPSLRGFTPTALCAVEQHAAGRACAASPSRLGRSSGGVQIGDRGAGAHAAALGHLVACRRRPARRR